MPGYATVGSLELRDLEDGGGQRGLSTQGLNWVSGERRLIRGVRAHCLPKK